MNDYEDFVGIEICEACLFGFDEGELEYDEDSQMYVCYECLENPPDDA